MFDAQTSPIMLIYSSCRGGSRVEGPTTASARRTAPTFLVVVLATLIAVGCSSERTPSSPEVARSPVVVAVGDIAADCRREDRKSTRLNSSHANISYAVFCLKK